MTEPCVGRLIWVLDDACCTAIAPDETWFVTGHEDGTVNVCDLATGEVRHSLTGHTAYPDTPEPTIWAIAFAPAGSWFATAGLDGTVRIWDPVTGIAGPVLTGPVPTGQVAGVTALAVAPDETWLASGDFDGGTVRVWEAGTGRLRWASSHSGASVSGIAIAPDGTWLTHPDNSGMVWLLDAATGHVLARPEGFPGWQAAIAPDGTWFVTGDADGTLRTWDAATGELRHTFDPHEEQGWITQIEIAPDGTWFATADLGELADNPRIRVWDLTTGRSRLRPKGFPGTTVAIAPDGSSVAVAAYGDHGLSLHDAATGHTILTRPWSRGKPHVATNVSWIASEGYPLVIWPTTAQPAARARSPHVPAVHSTAPSPALPPLQDEGVTVNGHITCPEGGWIAGACADGALRFWNLETGELIGAGRLPQSCGDPGPAIQIAGASVGAILAVAYERLGVAIWEGLTLRLTPDQAGPTDQLEWLPGPPLTLTANGVANLEMFV